MPEENQGRDCKENPGIPWSLFLVFPRIELKFPQIFNLGRKDELVAAQDEGAKVKFADRKPLTPPPLKLEVEETSDTHPLMAFPAYALGGFIVLNWIWARWKERQVRIKKESADDNESTDGYQSPDDDER